MNEDRQNVLEDWEIYDTVRIGDLVPDKWPGGYRTFTEMAADSDIGFLNIRNSSEVDKAYTNIASKDKLPWPFEVHSMGIRFIYPDPNVASDHEAAIAASKIFCTILPEHSHFVFRTKEDDRTMLKPVMAPPGHGFVGSMQSARPGNDTFNTVLGNGIPDGRNRWLFTIKNGIKLPKDTSIQATLQFSPYGKLLLQQLATVNPLDFGGEVPFANEALIELTLRGRRQVQQRGDYSWQ